MMSRLKFTGSLFLLGIGMAVGYSLLAPNVHAFAIYGSNIVQTGNWDGSGFQTGWSMPAGMTGPGDFTDYINSLLHNTSTYGIAGSDYNKYGAAFLVEQMMHGQSNQPANAALVSAALADYGTWASAVYAYSAAGRINWSLPHTFPSGVIDTLHVCNNGTFCNDRAVYFDNNYKGGGRDAHVFNYYTTSKSESATLIVFTNPNGTTFEIRRECGNIMGSAQPLQVGWTLSGATGMSPGAVYPGQQVTFSNSVTNNGPAPASFYWEVRYCWDSCPGGYSWGYGVQNSGNVGGMGAGGTMYAPNWFYVPPDNSHNKLCVWIAYSNASGPGTGASQSGRQCVDILPLQSICGPMTIAPTPTGPKDTYTLSSSVQVTGGVNGANLVNNASNYYVHVSGPGVNVNNNDVNPVTVGSAGANGTLSTAYAPGPTNNVGTYTVTWGITGPLAPVNCGPITFNVAYTPYFTVKGGDIAAGPGFGNGSCAEVTANIESWNQNTGNVPNYFGGGSVFGALATGSITNFVSGLGLAGAPAGQVGHGLSFANANNGQANNPPNYGGGFGAGSVACVKDYYGTKAGSGATTIGGPIMSLSSGTHIVTPDGTGTVTIGNGAHTPITVAPGTTETLYVQGNVYIESNIVYSNYTLSTVPRFNLYVQGSIYIDPNVTELHGVYIAQQSGVYKGDIITCAASPAAINEPYSVCSKKQLLVVGAMAAQGHMRLTRTYGNLEAVSGNGTPAAPSEIFQYSPELWLNAPPLTNLPIKTYTSLPPVL
ncbi:MAG TPA: hypothetical protein VLG92_00305 [Candidatus Saccharimonadia bacterium]|nr:hypothetical protein [Candidatus Saccharimonadia bacterium]